MFTGIVQGLAQVIEAQPADDFLQLKIQLPDEYSQNIQLGASIALNGTCLTVTQFEGNQVCFDVIRESLALTNLGECKQGSEVNFERAAKYGDEIGGHQVSGHISDCVSVKEVIHSENNCTIWFDLPSHLSQYILPKGFVSLNGCSLTIGEVTDSAFNVHLIPETLTRTTFGSAQPGQRINLEIDPQTQAIVDTVNRYLAQQSQ